MPSHWRRGRARKPGFPPQGWIIDRARKGERADQSRQRGDGALAPTRFRSLEKSRDPQGEQLLCQRQRPLCIGCGSKAVVDANVAAFRPSESFEPLTERRNTQLHFGMVFGQACEHNDTTRAPRAAMQPRRRAA